MAHSVSGYVLYVSMWFNTKFVRVRNLFFRGVYGTTLKCAQVLCPDAYEM